MYGFCDTIWKLDWLDSFSSPLYYPLYYYCRAYATQRSLNGPSAAKFPHVENWPSFGSAAMWHYSIGDCPLLWPGGATRKSD